MNKLMNNDEGRAGELIHCNGVGSVDELMPGGAGRANELMHGSVGGRTS